MFYRKKDILGLDIGTSSVKFVQLKNEGKRTKLIGYGKVKIPKNIILEGIVAEPEKLAELLKKNFSNAPWGKVTAKRIISSLPESKIFTRIIELPFLGSKDVEEAVKYEVEQSIPIPATDLYLDWQILEQNPEKMVVIFSAAPRSIVDSYVQLFNLLEMEPLALEPSLVALSRAMISNKNQVEPVIILDIGGATSNMAVFDSTLRVTESLPIGGITFEEKITQNLGIEAKDARLLVREGMKEGSPAAPIIQDEIEKLTVEIEKMINYHEEKGGGGKITKVLLCGGLAFMPGLTDLIQEKTKLEAKVGNPWVNISIYPIKPVSKDRSAGYAAAIGLSLRGFSDD